MKVIIAGSRSFKNYNMLNAVVTLANFPITEVVCGMAKGVDSLGERWANEHDIPVKEFPADWETHKNAAGPIRNAEMAKYCDAAIIFWDGKSPGSRHMVELIKKAKKPYVVFEVNKEPKKEHGKTSSKVG